MVKVCKRCGLLKPLSDFFPDKRASDKRRYICKLCGQKENREYKQANQIKARAWAYKSTLKTRYGITPAQYEQKLKEQNGGCAICGVQSSVDKLERRLHIDHDHATGKLRGILCDNCNHGIGKFKENEQLLLSAVNYIRLWTKK